MTPWEGCPRTLWQRVGAGRAVQVHAQAVSAARRPLLAGLRRPHHLSEETWGLGSSGSGPQAALRLGAVPLCVLGTTTSFLLRGATGQVCTFKATVMSRTCNAPPGQPQWGFCFEELSPVTLWSRLWATSPGLVPIFLSSRSHPSSAGPAPVCRMGWQPAVAQCAGGQEAEAPRGHVRSPGSQLLRTSVVSLAAAAGAFPRVPGGPGLRTAKA